MSQTDIEAGIVEAAAEQIDPARRELFLAFVRAVLAGGGSHPAGGSKALAALAVEAFEWAARRAPGEIRVRVRNPADRPGHTVVEVLQDDHPFIVDSLSLTFHRRGLRERFVIHPMLRLVRDADGVLEDVEAHPPNGSPLESYVYIELAPGNTELPNPAQLERAVLEEMGWVRDVTSDHRRMIRAVRQLMANLEYAREFVSAGTEQAADISRFLDWIVEGRFVFVGMRRYRVTDVEGEPEAQIVPGTGLGMWRDDSTSRLFEALRGKAIPSEILDDLEDPRIILISKSRMESHIHRHGRLDRIVLKEHDDRGRVTGFAIIVGLFTLAVLRTPGSQIPLLSERLHEVVERMGVNFGSHAHKAIVAAFDSVPVELLFGADVDAQVDLLEELVTALGSKRVRLLIRRHPRGRALYAAVLLPREQYRESLRVRIRHLLQEQCLSCTASAPRPRTAQSTWTPQRSKRRFAPCARPGKTGFSRRCANSTGKISRRISPGATKQLSPRRSDRIPTPPTRFATSMLWKSSPRPVRRSSRCTSIGTTT